MMPYIVVVMSSGEQEGWELTCCNGHAKEDWWEAAECGEPRHEGKALAEGDAGKEQGKDETAAEARQYCQADGEQLGKPYEQEEPPGVLPLRQHA